MTRESMSAAGIEGNDTSFDAYLTPDGRHVIFASDSTNLVPGDSGGRDIFVRDRVANRLTLESLSPTGAQVHNSFYPSISDDGRYIAFARTSLPTPGGTNIADDLYVRDRQLGQTLHVGVGRTTGPRMSGDGAYVAFEVYQERSLTVFTVVVYNRQTREVWQIAPGVETSPVTGQAIAFVTVSPIDPRDTDLESDIYLATAAPSQVPGPPREFTATVVGTTVSLRWLPPVWGHATSYVIEVGRAWGSAGLGRFDTGGAVHSVTVNVAPGSYYARIRAVNANGAGPPSNEVFVSVVP